MPDVMSASMARVDPQPPVSPSGGPRLSSRQYSGRNMALVAHPQDDSMLPELKSSDNQMDKSKPLPTTLQSDYIPENVLFALTQPPPAPEQLGPSARNRNLATSTMPTRKRGAALWNNPKRREKFSHLTQNTPCVCGAGNDISFLFDVPKKDDKKSKPDPADKSQQRAEEIEERKPMLTLPDTLIPEEYHIVKNKGVMGLEYYEDTYSTQPQDHEKHLVVFPSMLPASRFEVIQLKKTMEEMLRGLAVEDDSAELRGPSQMHNLLELIKKEQNIYNIIFHELIRQVSIECVERGGLLAELRDRYSQLLNRVPRQVKSLHEEVLAQRALDRRLTEELMRFKSTIGVLTSELSEVKEHDRQVTREAHQAQKDLKSALAESQKNAGLLAEYHDLYELQRKRLEKQVLMLAEEKEIWSTAAYSLALKVTEEHSLNTAKRLHVSEKSWAKLANHFTILLSDNDTVTLTRLQGFVDQWRDLVDDFNLNILQREEGMRKTLNGVKAGLEGWIKEFQKNILDKNGHLTKSPDREKTQTLYNNIKMYEEMLSSESDKFGGDTLLSGQEALHLVHKMMDGWTDAALKVFNRHRQEDGNNYPDHDDMLRMNEEVEELLRQYQVRLIGENGVATGLIQTTNAMETWDQKFNTVLHGSNPLPDAEWLRFYLLLDDWIASIVATIEMVGSTQKEDERQEKKPHRKVELADVMKITQKWLSSATNGIDSEDAKLIEQVSTLHTAMVKWMVQILLRLAPDRKEHSAEAREAVLLGSASIGELQSNAKSLFNQLELFSRYVTQCCQGIVLHQMQERKDRLEEDAEHEYRDLLKLKSECDEWIKTAKMLLSELTGEPFPESAPPTESQAQSALPKVEEGDEDKSQEEEGEEDEANKEDEEKETQDLGEKPLTPVTDVSLPKTPATVSDVPPRKSVQEMLAPSTDAPDTTDGAPGTTPLPNVEQIQIIGRDNNTHTAILDHPQGSPPPVADKSRPFSEQSGGPRSGTPDTKKAYEALAALETLQTQLISTEERAQVAEEKATEAELELKKALERIAVLERRLPAEPKEEEAEKTQAAESEATAPTEAGTPASDKTADGDKDKKSSASKKKKKAK